MPARILPDIFTYWLEKSGKSDIDLARHLDINKANIPPWKSGGRPIPEHHNKKIAEFFECRVEDLIDPGEDSTLRAMIVKRVSRLRGKELSGLLAYLQEHDPNEAKTLPDPTRANGTTG